MLEYYGLGYYIKQDIIQDIVKKTGKDSCGHFRYRENAIESAYRRTYYVEEQNKTGRLGGRTRMDRGGYGRWEERSHPFLFAFFFSAGYACKKRTKNENTAMSEHAKVGGKLKLRLGSSLQKIES